MSVVVPLFLIAPLFLVPFGLRLLAVATPGSEPPRLAMRVALPAALLLTLSFMSEPGVTAAALSLPWLALTGAIALAAGVRLLKDPARFRPSVRHATDAAVAFLAVGATFATIDRLGARPFDLPSEIILLTAVHFHFAGFVLPLTGALAYGRRPARWLEVALGAVVVGIPITALGFLGIPYADWIGAMLTAAGGFGVGVATVLVASRLGTRIARVLATIAGASLLISMPMAAVYASGNLINASWLGVEIMARVHGGLNALGFALPIVIAWTLDRQSRELPIERPPARDPRRLGLGAAAIIAGYAVVVGAIMVGLTGIGGSDEYHPPTTALRSLTLFGLFLLPAVVAAIGATRRSRPLLVAAGVLALGQSFIAFSGITIPFVVPAILLIALGADRRGTAGPRRAAIGALAVVALGIGAWIVPFALSETSCWIARSGPGGTIVYSQTPVTDTSTLGLGDLAAGCDGGTFTIQGAGLAVVLGIGAVAMAALASDRPANERPTSEALA